VIGMKGPSSGKGWRAQRPRQAGVVRRRKVHARTFRGSRLAAVGIAGTLAVLLVPTVAAADPVGSTGEPPAIVQPAPPGQGTAQNPVVPVTPGAKAPSVTGLGNSNGVIVTGCAFDACLQGGGWSNGARLVGVGAGIPGVQIAPQYGTQPEDSSWGIVGALQSPLSAIPGMGGNLQFKYDTATGLQWQFSSSMNSNGGAIGQTWVPGQGWVWNDPKQVSGYGAGVSSSILGYRIIGPDKVQGPYPTGDGMMSYPPGYQLPPAHLNDWSDAFGPNERPQSQQTQTPQASGETFDQRWGPLTQALPGGTPPQMLDTLRQTLQGPAPAGIPQDTWDSARKALETTTPSGSQAPTGDQTPPAPPSGQPDGNQQSGGNAVQPGDSGGSNQSSGSGTVGQPAAQPPAEAAPSAGTAPAAQPPAETTPPAGTAPATTPPPVDQSAPSGTSSGAGQSNPLAAAPPAPPATDLTVPLPTPPPPPQITVPEVPTSGSGTGGTGDTGSGVGSTSSTTDESSGVGDTSSLGNIDSGAGDSGGAGDGGGGGGGGGD
jgi:hypothetical protein